MKLTLLTAMAALLAPALASAADVTVDGKGVICPNDEDYYKLPWGGHSRRAYKFVGGKAHLSYLRDGAQGLEIYTGQSSPRYRANAAEVTWLESNAAYGYSLDRRSLLMTVSSPYKEVYMQWRCEAYATTEAFDAALEKILNREIEAREAYMSKNKI